MINLKDEDFFAKLKGKISFNEPLSKHTWLGVGGAADIMFHPKDADDLSFFLKNCPKNIPVFILGGGSNLLIRDGGLEGIVIKLDAPFFKQVHLNSDILTCGAGFHNVLLKKVLIKEQLGGLEFLCSIPGTIGGLIKTNAGCFSRSVSDVLVKALVMDEQGNIKEFKNKDFNFSYRHSNFPEGSIILSVDFKTEPSSKTKIEEIINEQQDYRDKNQPCHEKTAGSTFKNPEGHRAWELIKKAGCENLNFGDAKVSEKHCNFIINKGKATAADIEKLGETIIKRVKDKTGVQLEWEVIKTGRQK